VQLDHRVLDIEAMGGPDKKHADIMSGGGPRGSWFVPKTSLLDDTIHWQRSSTSSSIEIPVQRYITAPSLTAIVLFATKLGMIIDSSANSLNASRVVISVGNIPYAAVHNGENVWKIFHGVAFFVKEL